MNAAVVIDFETTGLSPRYGDRTIEDKKDCHCCSEVPFKLMRQLGEVPGKKVNEFLAAAEEERWQTSG